MFDFFANWLSWIWSIVIESFNALMDYFFVIWDWVVVLADSFWGYSTGFLTSLVPDGYFTTINNQGWFTTTKQYMDWVDWFFPVYTLLPILFVFISIKAGIRLARWAMGFLPTLNVG